MKDRHEPVLGTPTLGRHRPRPRDIRVSSLAVSVLLAVVSAAAYAAAAVLQERLAAAGTVFAVLRRGRWWLSVALNAAGGLLHLAALKYGPLTAVQPLGVLTLVLALPLSATLIGRRVAGTEWRGAALTTVGVAGLLLLTSSTEPLETLRAGEALAVIAATATALAVLMSAAAATRGPLARSLLHATGSGIAFGVSSALTQTVTLRVSEQGAHALLTPAGSIETIAIAALIAAGLLLAQTSYANGLGAPLAAATLANPAAATAIGLALLDQHYTAGAAGVALALAAAALATRGVVLLAIDPAADRRRRPSTHPATVARARRDPASTPQPAARLPRPRGESAERHALPDPPSSTPAG
jgi:uncharacterized membrane protein